ncbi:unnamed protein product [Microthlaspi erraticum]|uniref:DUF4283 domain-containing protein n=1 Tax=Microthlaspi erraticum TaxID=1685480 RepID=A0A6D2JSD0_9BRAS|nr:unnamed protein product [Microthlaspi erraticum]
MSQANALKSGGSNKWKETLRPRLRLKLPHFDNSELIKGYSTTLIGRCMNPQKQDVKSLIFIFPRIWNMENRVTGADLDLGRFQFDFDEEEDIIEVLKMEPFHFDSWMVSLVRWQTEFDPLYPSEITFWVRGLDLPLQVWAELTLHTVGNGSGEVKAVDIDGGQVQVGVNGIKPLHFETTLEIQGEQCPLLYSHRVERDRIRRREVKTESRALSYKGVVKSSASDAGRFKHEERRADYKGTGKMVESRDEQGQRQTENRG